MMNSTLCLMLLLGGVVLNILSYRLGQVLGDLIVEIRKGKVA